MGMCISLSLHSKLKKTLFAMLLLVLLMGNLRMYFGYLRANLTLGVCSRSYCISMPNDSHNLLLIILTSTPYTYILPYNSKCAFLPDATKKSNMKAIINTTSFSFLIYEE